MAKRRGIEVEIDGFQLTQEPYKRPLTAREELAKRYKALRLEYRRCSNPHEKARLYDILVLMKREARKYA